MPFSTTALAKKLGRICFYDVCGIHLEFDKIFENIPIISFSELKNGQKIRWKL